LHVLSSFQRTGLASNEPRRLCWRLGNLAILLTLGFCCQPLSEVFFRIFFQRRAADPGGRALIEVGVANPRFSERKKNLLAVCARRIWRLLEQICQPTWPGHARKSKYTHRPFGLSTPVIHRGLSLSVGSCSATASPRRTVFKRTFTDYTSTFRGTQALSASGLQLQLQSPGLWPADEARTANGFTRTAAPRRFTLTLTSRNARSSGEGGWTWTAS